MNKKDILKRAKQNPIYRKQVIEKLQKIAVRKMENSPEKEFNQLTLISLEAFLPRTISMREIAYSDTTPDVKVLFTSGWRGSPQLVLSLDSFDKAEFSFLKPVFSIEPPMFLRFNRLNGSPAILAKALSVRIRSFFEEYPSEG
jgi:hypothetical protein